MEYHGFYQDKDFKWTYKSHNGIFIPTVLDNNIQGLRILLDEKYNVDTENIWFSSNNEYNGTKAYNWPTILQNNMSWSQMYNTKNQTIIIATEMILAHKLFYNTDKIVVGIPNCINKELILNIVKRLNATEVFLYADRYTILHTAERTIGSIISTLEEKNVKVKLNIALNEEDIGKDFIEKENKKIA